jgi:hypothetical protein
MTRRTLAYRGAALFTAASYGRILGANERINLGLIGCGDRGEHVSTVFTNTKQVDPVSYTHLTLPTT